MTMTFQDTNWTESVIRRNVFSAVIATLLLSMLAPVDAADPTERQKQSYSAIVKFVDDAGKTYLARNYEDSASSIEAAARELQVLVKMSSAETYDKLIPMMRRIERAHALLELEGVPAPPLYLPSRSLAATELASAATSTTSRNEPMAKPVAAAVKPTRVPPKPKTPPTNNVPMNLGVSFTSVVQPILVGRCGQCHVSGSKGGFQMSSYETLMKGPAEGVVVFPGDVIASRLIETIETGDMPRGGGKVPPNELMALKTWVAQGAKFDGPDPTATFAGTPAATAATSDAPMVARATGNETVSFASDIAPLLVENCNGCHIDAMQTRGGLRLDTFVQMLRGGDSGAAITPGKGEASLLVRKLRGSEGDRMPAGGRPPLSDDSIALVSKWIDEGATLDGASGNQPIKVMSQLAWVSNATPAEVSERRAELAAENLSLANAAKANVEQTSTQHFNVIGTASAGTLKMVAEQAELLMAQSRSLVSGPNGQAYFHGKATIFVLPKRYDYSEFAKMVEQRSVPAEWNSHWQSDGIDAYIAMVASDRDEPDSLAARLLTPIAALAMATRGGDIPRWFAEGVGVSLAARGRGVLDRDARRKLEGEIYEAAAAMDNAKKFLEGKLTPEQSDRIGAALVASMVDRSRRRQFDALLRELDAGSGFEPAFQKSFGLPVAGYVDGWLRMVRGG